jgi:ATP-dependent Zn protease
MRSRRRNAVRSGSSRRIAAEVQRSIDEGHEAAKRLLQQHRKALDVLVAALLARETLDEQEIREVTGLSLELDARGDKAADVANTPGRSTQRAAG